MVDSVMESWHSDPRSPLGPRCAGRRLPRARCMSAVPLPDWLRLQGVRFGAIWRGHVGQVWGSRNRSARQQEREKTSAACTWGLLATTTGAQEHTWQLHCGRMRARRRAAGAPKSKAPAASGRPSPGWLPPLPGALRRVGRRRARGLCAPQLIICLPKARPVQLGRRAAARVYACAPAAVVHARAPRAAAAVAARALARARAARRAGRGPGGRRRRRRLVVRLPLGRRRRPSANRCRRSPAAMPVPCARRAPQPACISQRCHGPHTRSAGAGSRRRVALGGARFTTARAARGKPWRSPVSRAQHRPSPRASRLGPSCWPFERPEGAPAAGARHFTSWLAPLRVRAGPRSSNEVGWLKTCMSIPVGPRARPAAASLAHLPV